MSNHLNTMLDMETNSALKDYITSIMEQYDIKKRTTFSNNNVLNGLISEYSSKCCAENIEFVVDIRSGTIDDIGATDIVALFGNILSNAYEAARQCFNKSDKYIELIAKRKNETTFIKCVNSCDVPPKVVRGRFVSIKKDNDRKHGYGMKSIDKIVDKYNGSHIEQFDETRHEFTISLMLIK
jgi:two-component system sensor histidine kinase AgrC